VISFLFLLNSFFSSCVASFRAVHEPVAASIIYILYLFFIIYKKFISRDKTIITFKKLAVNKNAYCSCIFVYLHKTKNSLDQRGASWHQEITGENKACAICTKSVEAVRVEPARSCLWLVMYAIRVKWHARVFWKKVERLIKRSTD
jgi:hypothetical protein